MIILIENDSSYGKYLKKTLIDKGYELKYFTSGIEALEALEHSEVDLIVSTYYMPNIRGDEFQRRVEEIKPKTPIIFISHESDKRLIKSMMRHKNIDFMVKPVVLSELLARVELFLEETSKVGSSNKIKVGNIKLNLETFKAEINGSEVKLSPTEFSLLKYLMINKNTVLTRGMILTRIWGYDTEVSTRVVDVYIGYLREKLENNGAKNYIKTVRGFGYSIQD